MKKSWKLLLDKRKLRGWKKTRLTCKLDDICEEAMAEVEFSGIIYYKLKLWLTFPDLSPLIWILEKIL